MCICVNAMHVCVCRRFYHETTLGRKYLFRFTLYDHLIWFIYIRLHRTQTQAHLNTHTLAVNACYSDRETHSVFFTSKSINKTLQLIQYYGLIITRPKNANAALPISSNQIIYIFSTVYCAPYIRMELSFGWEYFKCIILYNIKWESKRDV